MSLLSFGKLGKVTPGNNPSALVHHGEALVGYIEREVSVSYVGSTRQQRVEVTGYKVALVGRAFSRPGADALDEKSFSTLAEAKKALRDFFVDLRARGEEPARLPSLAPLRVAGHVLAR
jgi:hypothetical protein